MYLLLNLSHFVKSLSNFGFFTMPTHQLWSCHVAEVANFENFYFVLVLHLNIRKSPKTSGGKALYFNSYQPKHLTVGEGGGGGGGGVGPVALGLT